MSSSSASGSMTSRLSAETESDVTLVFSWNMQARWIEYFFKRISKLHNDYSAQGIQIVGLSRLAKFDAMQGGTVPELTDDQELDQYQAWKNQYGVVYPLAVGAYGDTSLMDDWACNVIPAINPAVLTNMSRV